MSHWHSSIMYFSFAVCKVAKLWCHRGYFLCFKISFWVILIEESTSERNFLSMFALQEHFRKGGIGIWKELPWFSYPMLCICSFLLSLYVLFSGNSCIPLKFCLQKMRLSYIFSLLFAYMGGISPLVCGYVFNRLLGLYLIAAFIFFSSMGQNNTHTSLTIN
jgi:hypothetical protein